MNMYVSATSKEKALDEARRSIDNLHKDYQFMRIDCPNGQQEYFTYS